jgi:dihydroorotate dehydrogenase (NAD+) catalytic subunit
MLRPSSRFRWFGVTQKMLNDADKQAISLADRMSALQTTADNNPPTSRESDVETPPDRAAGVTRHVASGGEHTQTFGDVTGVDDRAGNHSMAGVIRRYVELIRCPLGEEASEELRADARRLAAAFDANPDEPERSRLRQEVRRVFSLGELQVVLASQGMSSPAYDTMLSFAANEDGPSDRLPLAPSVSRATKTPSRELFGRTLAAPIGIAASPLTTNSKWIEYYAQRGYNVITYKTVRNRFHRALPHPNWLFMDENEKPWPVTDASEGRREVHVRRNAWPRSAEFSMINSVGVPSVSDDEWTADVQRCLKLLRDDQILLVSVMGSPEDLDIDTQEKLEADFVLAASTAASTGAHAIELNFSCPNHIQEGLRAVSDEHLIYRQPDQARSIVEKVRREVGEDAKIVIKLGWLTYDGLDALITPISHLIDGVSGINAMQWPVTCVPVDADDESPLFPPPSVDWLPGTKFASSRDLCGVSGTAIRAYGQDFVHSLFRLRERSKANWKIIGMGGVMTSQDVNDLLSLGADAVQCVTAAFFDPNFAETLEVDWETKPKTAASVAR